MQTEVPTLPIVYSEGNIHSNRKVKKGIAEVSPTEKNEWSKIIQHFEMISSHWDSTGGPYRDSMRMHCQSEPAQRVSTTCKNYLGQRIISAKILRVKELQNQLTDAHYHLNELANENRLLKALQKRQDSALKQYMGKNAELPRIISSHEEELKVFQTKYKQLRLQHKQTCDSLKDRENEIYSLHSQNKHLLKLNKDQHLLEREKLQMQVLDLNHVIEEQHQTIQTLNRKLTLQSKKFKHQIGIEVTKHKETQKELRMTLEKLKTLEDMLNSREKRQYSNPHGHQLPSFNRRKPTTSQSLTNLRNNSGTSNFIKASKIGQNAQNDVIKNETLPKLNMKKSNGVHQIIKGNNSNEIVDGSETMSSLDQIRKFKLPKSSASRHSSPYASDENEMRDKLKIEMDFGGSKVKANGYDCEGEPKEVIDNGMNGDIVNNRDKKLRRESDFMSGHSDMSDDESPMNDKMMSPTLNSKHLHARLVNSTTNGASSTDEETFYTITNKKSRVLKKSANEKVRKLSVQNDDINNDISLKNQDVTDSKNISLPEFPRFEVVNNSLFSSSRQSVYDMKKNLTTSRRNSLNNSGEKFDTNNEESFKNGTDLWTQLRERLNRVREKSNNSPRLILNSTGPSTIDNGSISNLESDKKTGEESDELLRYFDVEKNNEFNRLTISNGDNSELGNNENLSWKSNITPEKNNHLSNTDNQYNIEKNIGLSIEYQNDDAPIIEEINVYHNPTSKQESIQEHSDTIKTTNFNKQKLLAAMKAIDDNENIEFTPEKKSRETYNLIRSQVTENLYRGLPTHTRKRDDIIKDIFSDTKIESKLQSGCSKLH